MGLTVLLASAAAPAEQPSPMPSPNTRQTGENGEMLQSRGSPTSWALTYNSDASADIDGGIDRSATYLQRIGLIGDADLDRLVGWRGATAHISIHLINGSGLSDRVGTLLTVSGLEADPAARLFNLWVEQKLGENLTLRAGQFTAGQEFAVSPTASLFVNSTFGWPASFATNLPSGGPAYPLAAPGLRLSAALVGGLAARVAIFAGDPAGPGSGSAQQRDLHGFNGFGLAGRPFVIGEVTRSSSGADPAWTLTVGGWIHTGSFDDLGADPPRGPYSSPVRNIPLRHRGNGTIYVMTDARLWRSGRRQLRGFVRASVSPADRNPIDLYLDAGLTLSGPVRSRPDDTVGIGVAVARISPRLRSSIIQNTVPPYSDLNVPGFEGVIEASWQFKVAARFYLQPNVQIILHPAAALLAGGPFEALPSRAIVIGLRTSFRM